ncbi:hypothetical protein LEP1GSC062_0467 [Leptospira alexanderi serovar Manhao 3 str. L 60]|uniref:Uncharacterized protein n=1 Tax=Leptospira alexanderi serovar Manhao 3 str. L 60 TaxID=1049759 RepID=V6I3Z8_9LEPT|nr:hypothetical protein LEP1GSC062_0467 [Leptospira alexanderi serovar Manhao 3 str. L 60]
MILAQFNLFDKCCPKTVQCGTPAIFFSDFGTSSVRVKGNSNVYGFRLAYWINCSKAENLED